MHEMLSLLGAEGTRQNDYAEDFSNYWERLVDSDSVDFKRYSARAVNDSIIQTMLWNPRTAYIFYQVDIC